MDNELIQAISATKYLTPSRYVSGRIVEYDIKSANISVLREYNIITQEDYDLQSELESKLFSFKLILLLILIINISYFHIYLL